MENPVYYVQYAHARIASIARKAPSAASTRRRSLDADLSPLAHERELELLRALALYPDVLPRRPSCARRTASPRGCATSRRGSTASTATAGCSPTTPRSPRRGCGSPRPAASGSPTRSASSASRARRDGAPRRRRRIDGRERVTDARRAAPFDPSLVAAPGLLGAATSPRSPHEFGTPLYVYDEDELPGPLPRVPRPRSARTPWRTRARRSCAPRWPASSPRKGSTSTSRPAASCTSRCAPGFPPARIVFHGNNKSRRRAARRARRRRRPHRRRLVRRARPLERSSRTGSAPPGARARHPGRRGAHARVHRDRRRTTRSSGSRSRQRRRARRGPTRCRRRPRSTFAGFHCHIGSQVFRLDSFARAAAIVAALAAECRARDRRAGRGAQPRRRPRRARTSPTTTRRRSPSHAASLRDARGAARRRSVARAG